MTKGNKIYNFYRKLDKKYGNPRVLWPQWCASKKDEKLREIIAIGAILTQRTSWTNAHMALRSLKKKKLLSLSKISNLKNLAGLTQLITPAGFYQTKPKRLLVFAKFVIKEYGSLERMRQENGQLLRQKLLNLYGIGPETADTILLYALDKPSFVIDEYTKRFVKKYNLARAGNYNQLKAVFEKFLPRSVEIYQNYHTLIIVDNKGKNKSKMKVI